MTNVEAVNRNKRLYFDGQKCWQVVDWFDSDGDDCEPEFAVVCIARRKSDFVVIDLRDYDSQSTH